MKPIFGEFTGKIVDLVNSHIYKGKLTVSDGKILRIEPSDDVADQWIMPGFIDAHVHIESSMLIPSEFARLASVHGTVGTVSDPHEIANVLGIEGVKFMMENGKKVPFKFHFGAPSCVPATSFETSGAIISAVDLGEMMKNEEILYMSEMMNFPGVVYDDPEVMAKLSAARKLGKPVDGHAPGLKGEQLAKYISAGISTDHECFTIEEAREKIKLGMKILIREGSAARNFDELLPLVAEYPEMVMFCSDDKHPDDLTEGHINLLVKRAVEKGYDILSVLKSAILNPIQHYGLKAGLLRPGDPADFIIVEDVTGFNVLATYVDGIKTAEKGKTLIEGIQETRPNKFVAAPVTIEDISLKAEKKLVHVIRAYDGQLITRSYQDQPALADGNFVSDIHKDILKLVVINRYQNSKPAIGFINGFGFKHGAIASTVAHDSHNIIAVGATDEEIVSAINLVIRDKGGIAYFDNERPESLPLPVGGIMSHLDGYEVARLYQKINTLAKSTGSLLSAPFMTLSFMALLVIPELKLSDKGLFDGLEFKYKELFV